MPEIFALLIFFLFFIAALSFSPIGKAIADSIFRKNNQNYIHKKYQELEAKITEHETEINKLREIIIFNEELRNRNSKTEPNINKLNQSKKQIDLDKS